MTTTDSDPETDLDWTRQGRCRGVIAAGVAKDREFFPEFAQDRRWQPTRDALCVGCPVRAECLLFALTNCYTGLWGGEVLTWASLRALRAHYAITS